MWAILARMLGFASTVALGWMGSDINNESARTKQMEAVTGDSVNKPFISVLGSWVIKNWVLILVVGIALYFVNKFKTIQK